MSDTDREIVEKIRNGDQRALQSLFDSYYNDLVVHALKMVINRGVAEDTVQEVFIRLWKNRDTFILEKTFQSYLFAAVRNRSINYLKSRYGRIRFEELDQIGPVLNDHTADGELAFSEVREAIQAAVNLLPPKCRIVFNLSRNAGFTSDEIAGSLGLSRRTVQTQISIAIKKIKDHLKDQWDHLL